jgi:hypothetical protein
MKTIVCAGFYRSGSTWLFNAVKSILLLSGAKVNQSGNQFQSDTNCDFFIHKVHDFDDELSQKADIIITSSRNLKDARNSFRSFMKRDMDEEKWKQSLSDYSRWRMLSDYDMDFYRMMYDRDLILLDLMDILKIEVSMDELRNKIDSIKPPKSGHDPDSFYFSNHITNPKSEKRKRN